MKRYFAIAVLGTTALRSGCVGGAPQAESESAPPAAEPVPIAWQTDELDLMSSPVGAGDVVLSIVSTQRNTLHLIAFDLETGEERWRQRVLVGTTAPGVDISVSTLEKDGKTLVAALIPLRPDPWNGWGTAAVLDAATGENLTPDMHDQAFAGSRPSACGEAFCIVGWPGEGGETAVEFAFSPGSTSFVVAPPQPGSGYLEGGRFLGGYISASWPNGVETLSYGADGAIVWQRPYEEVFGPGTSSNAGWAWDDAQDWAVAIGIGYPHTPRDISQPADIVRDMTDARAVGVQTSTGATEWTLEGLQWCAGVGRTRTDESEIAVLCRWNSGTRFSHWDGQSTSNVKYENVDIDMVGVNSTTGEILWELPLGSDPSNYDERLDTGVPRVQGDSIVAKVDGELSAVDRETGKVTPVDSQTPILCHGPEGEKKSVSSAWNNGEPFLYSQSDRLQLCDLDGKHKTDALPTTETFELAGIDTTEPIVLNMNGKITLFKQEG
ncbi:hypothetical protein ACQUSY_12035 [Microbacterium sp. YY-03]|uniref:hypothetical protein n=1 Tax=Microbacterium sp. YY-03 TaxID=3421636 RepID=UPI003D17FD49